MPPLQSQFGAYVDLLFEMQSYSLADEVVNKYWN